MTIETKCAKSVLPWIPKLLSNPTFWSEMKDVRRDFLQATGRTSITGIPFGVMAVLIAERASR